MTTDLKDLLVEIGNEATVIKTRLKELVSNVEEETSLVIKDYTKLDLKKSRVLVNSLNYDELIDMSNIIKSLAYENNLKVDKIRGWRILSKTSLEEQDIALLTRDLTSLGKTIHSNLNTYRTFLGEEKATLFKEEIDKIKLSYFS
jgi:DNA integrity scanning protein DisA with diadenylate cyclase activity